MRFWIALIAGLGLGQTPVDEPVPPPQDPSIRDPAAAALQDAYEEAAENADGARPPEGYAVQPLYGGGDPYQWVTPVLPNGSVPPTSGQVANEEATQVYQPLPSPLPELREQAGVGGSGDSTAPSDADAVAPADSASQQDGTTGATGQQTGAAGAAPQDATGQQAGAAGTAPQDATGQQAGAAGAAPQDATGGAGAAGTAPQDATGQQAGAAGAAPQDATGGAGAAGTAPLDATSGTGTAPQDATGGAGAAGAAPQTTSPTGQLPPGTDTGTSAAGTAPQDAPAPTGQGEATGGSGAEAASPPTSAGQDDATGGAAAAGTAPGSGMSTTPGDTGATGTVPSQETGDTGAAPVTPGAAPGSTGTTGAPPGTVGPGSVPSPDTEAATGGAGTGAATEGTGATGTGADTGGTGTTGTPPGTSAATGGAGTAGTPGAAGTAQAAAQPSPTEQELAKLRERVNQLETELETRGQDLDLRNQAVQLQVDTFGQRAAETEQARQQRLTQIQTAGEWMLAADEALESGELGVDNALNLADAAFTNVRDSAARYGQGSVIVHVERARALINRARDAASNRDIYGARLALQDAGGELALARTANLQRQATGNVMLTP